MGVRGEGGYAPRGPEILTLRSRPGNRRFLKSKRPSSSSKPTGACGGEAPHLRPWVLKRKMAASNPKSTISGPTFLKKLLCWTSGSGERKATHNPASRRQFWRAGVWTASAWQPIHGQADRKVGKPSQEAIRLGFNRRAPGSPQPIERFFKSRLRGCTRPLPSGKPIH